MKKNYRGIGFYIGLVLIVILVWYLLGNSQDTTGAYTYAEFEKALDKDEVVAVTIQQNREIPTGVLRITLKNEQSVKLNVSDVNDAQQLMEKYDFDSYEEDDDEDLSEDVLADKEDEIQEDDEDEVVRSISEALKKNEDDLEVLDIQDVDDVDDVKRT